jgi:hypothetical protein
MPFSQSNVLLVPPAAAIRWLSLDDAPAAPVASAPLERAPGPAALVPATVPAVPYVLLVVPAPVLGVLPGGSIDGGVPLPLDVPLDEVLPVSLAELLPMPLPELPLVPPELLPMPLPLVRPELLPLVMLGVVLPAVPMSELPLPDAPPMSLPVLPPLVSPAGFDAAEPAELAVRDDPDDEVSVPVLAQAPSSREAAATVVIASALMRMYESPGARAPGAGPRRPGPGRIGRNRPFGAGSAARGRRAARARAGRAARRAGTRRA